MQISSSTESTPIVTVVVAGRLDALNAQELRAEMRNYAESGNHRIVVDLSDAEFIDSAGLAVLVAALKNARSNNGDVRLVAPARPQAAHVFSLTGFDQIFTFASSAKAARRSW